MRIEEVLVSRPNYKKYDALTYQSNGQPYYNMSSGPYASPCERNVKRGCAGFGKPPVPSPPLGKLSYACKGNGMCALQQSPPSHKDDSYPSMRQCKANCQIPARVITPHPPLGKLSYACKGNGMCALEKSPPNPHQGRYPSMGQCKANCDVHAHLMHTPHHLN